MSTTNACIAMGFLLEGNVLQRLDSRTVERNEGAIGVMDIFALYAECIVEFLDEQVGDFPGVFHYEVTPGLGLWAVGESLPSVDKFRDELKRRFTEWIDDAKVTYEVVNDDGRFDVIKVTRRGKSRAWVATCLNKTLADTMIAALSE